MHSIYKLFTCDVDFRHLKPTRGWFICMWVPLSLPSRVIHLDSKHASGSPSVRYLFPCSILIRNLSEPNLWWTWGTGEGKHSHWRTSKQQHNIHTQTHNNTQQHTHKFILYTHQHSSQSMHFDAEEFHLPAKQILAADKPQPACFPLLVASQTVNVNQLTN